MYYYDRGENVKGKQKRQGHNISPKEPPRETGEVFVKKHLFSEKSIDIR